MKKVHFKITAVVMVIAMAVAVTSCKKYEEGPLVSLAGKKGRVVNIWKTDSEFNDGKEETLDSDDKLGTVEFTKDGKFIFQDYTDGVADTPDKGIWEFNSHKTALGLKFDGSCDPPYPGCDSFFYITILKLKKNEMWLGEPGGLDYTVFVSK